MSTTMDFGGSGSSAYDGMCGNCGGTGTAHGSSCGYCDGSGQVHASPAPSGGAALGSGSGTTGDGGYLGDAGGGWAQPGIGSGLDTGMAE